MLTIKLHHLRFTAYHGLYAEEQLAGNEFEVNISIHYNPKSNVLNHLHETIDYGAIYKLVQMHMGEAIPLLETWVMQMAHKIMSTYSYIDSVAVCIKKLHPPIMNFEGNVEVCYTVNN